MMAGALSDKSPESTATPAADPGMPPEDDVYAFLVLPRLWMGERLDTDGNLDAFDFRPLFEAVIGPQRLSNGIFVRIDRDGFCWFDFSATTDPLTAPVPGVRTDFHKLVELRNHRIKVLNIFLVCLYTATSRDHPFGIAFGTMVVDLNNIVTRNAIGSSVGSLPMGVAGEIDVQMRGLPNPASNIGVAAMLIAIARGFVIRREVLTAALQMLDDVLARANDDARAYIELYLRACRAFEEHNYSLALTHAWTVTEKLLRTRWIRYVDGRRPIGDGTNRFNSKRRDKLIDGTEFSAYVIGEVLMLADHLTPELVPRMAEVRSKRNDWLHKMKAVNWETAHEALKVAEEMLKEVSALELRVPVQMSVRG